MTSMFFLSLHPFLATLDPMGYAEFQFSPLAIGIPITMAIALITETFMQEFAPFCHHYVSRHDFHQVMKTISFLRLLANELRNLYFFKSIVCMFSC